VIVDTSPVFAPFRRHSYYDEQFAINAPHRIGRDRQITGRLSRFACANIEPAHMEWAKDLEILENSFRKARFTVTTNVVRRVKGTTYIVNGKHNALVRQVDPENLAFRYVNGGT
jgi:hypothetical protein